MRLLRLSLLCLAVCAAMLLPQLSHANPRYSALIVDSATGDVLFSAHANERRYPASLTKMMTLYLVFEAIRDGRLSLDTKMNISRFAASKPQTNLSLRAGNTISVRDGIKALVVRSANDVATVFAEHLGRSEWEFGQVMTAKARQLGMSGTVFRNANGLPDAHQYTTARDMAVLGMSLRKHFPDQMHFFQTRDFYYNGRNYHTHNHVLERLPGAEGMKTGFINASGFNVVTSVTRGGKNLMGVVMGGRTAYTRDAHMIKLMEQAYADLAGKSGASANQYAAASVPKPAKLPFNRMPRPIAKPAAPASAAIQLASADPKGWAANVARPGNPAPLAKVVKAPLPMPEMAAPPPSPPPQQMQAFAPQPSVATGFSRNWGIQVGAYYKAPEALMAAIHVSKLAAPELAGAKIAISDGQEPNGTAIHRARLANMDENQARLACQKLLSLRQSCFVIQLDGSGNL